MTNEKVQHPIITHQAFARINSDSQWVYCKWSDDTYIIPDDESEEE